jgi:Tol biopolymer transport system component
LLEARQREVGHGQGGSFDSPSWSPDGRLVAFYCCEDEPHRIRVTGCCADPRSTDVSLEPYVGDAERVLYDDGVDSYWPTWSPVDLRLAFQRDDDATQAGNDILIMGPDDAAPRLLDIPPAGGVQVAWSPDGKDFLLIKEDYVNFMIVSADGTHPPIPITNLDAPTPQFNLRGSWQPILSQ